MTAANPAKQAVRERVWSQLETAGVVEPGVRGYIPAFEGADQAAGRLADLPVWQRAQILEVVPDRAQLPVRIRALKDGQARCCSTTQTANWAERWASSERTGATGQSRGTRMD